MPENKVVESDCSASSGSKELRELAGTSEIVERLNELLEAERAGALVAFETAASVADPSVKELIGVIHRDEGRWCSMLVHELARLGAAGSRKVGSFREKAMAISEIDPRLLFLNKGQSWVVQRIKELLSRVEDEQLRAELADMRDAHIRNIEATRQLLDARASQSHGKISNERSMDG